MEAASLWTRQSSWKGRTLPVRDLLAETDKNVRDNLLTFWGAGGERRMQGEKAARCETGYEAISERRARDRQGV